MTWDWEKLKQQQQGKGPVPPQMDEFVEKLRKIKFPGGPLFVIVILLAALAITSVYTVKQNEVGVVQLFGRYTRTTQPGLNFKLPLGIESVTKVNVREIQTEEFGFSTGGSQVRPSRFSSGTENTGEALMLTGDLNVAIVPWIVQFRVKNPFDFLFKVRDVRRLLRDMSEATMRLVVGDRSINEVISKRDEIAVEAKGRLQSEMDQAETGIHIVTIEMKKTNVPPPVQPSFNEVNQAVQEKEQMIYQAREDYNKAIPAARGEAERTIRASEGYALNRVNRAKGNADRFVAVYNQYVNAKDITKRRLYLETIQQTFPNLDQKYIIDADQKNLLPFLNLGQSINAGQQSSGEK
jgi:membrane protease subunit HflK